MTRRKRNIQWSTKHDWATRIALNTGMKLGAPEGWNGPVPLLTPWCCSCYKPGDKLWMRKGPCYDDDKQHIRGHLWQIFLNCWPNRSSQRNDFNLIIRNPWFSIFYVSKEIVMGTTSSGISYQLHARYILHMQALQECCFI